MNRQAFAHRFRLGWLLFAVFAWPVASVGQVAVPEIEELEEYPTISAAEIEELVGPIALYPDDLLAIVLPASTYPLQVVEAARFLEDLKDDPSLEPDEDWDDSIVALLNYPEVVELLNEDLDWTWRLGEAVVGQQSDIIAAIEDFRDRAYAAGNLKSDDYQLVSQDEGTIQITPVQDDVIYVPYYEPEQVVIYQPRPVYYYYPRAYPVYYYPYPSYYSFHNHFHRSHFWGVTTAFAIGWHSYHLSTFHHSFYGHPYYGHSYWDRWWYRRPDIHVYNNTYVRTNVNTSYNRYRNGDYWAPRERRTVRRSDQRITRTRYYPSSDSRSSTSTNTRTYTNTNRSGQVARNTSSVAMQRDIQRRGGQDPIQFRNRSNKTTISPSSGVSQRTVNPGHTRKSGSSSGPPRSSSRNSVSQRRSEPVAAMPRPRPSSLSRPSSKPKAAPQRSSQPRSSQLRSRSEKPQSRSSQSRSRSEKSQARPSRSSKSEDRSSRSSRSSRESGTRSSRKRR